MPARETRGKALSDKNVPGQGAERGICRVVHQAAGVRGRENNRVLLHGEQQVTGSFFQQVFQPIVRRIRRERKISLYITGDEEKKTDKATRIEANLEPLNREGNLILNEAEKDNPHMKRMAEQFKLFNLQLTYPADGPDCVEGGNRIIDRKARQSEKPVIVTRKSTRSQNKYRV